MSKKLLLADDSVTIQRVIELTFADEDIDVVTVADGDAAVAQLTADPPDIVLADVGMPGRDGYEVARHVRRTPALAHVPVVLLTGAFDPIDEARARDAGCAGVLVKPFEPQMVIARVRELLSAGPRATRTTAAFDTPGRTHAPEVAERGATGEMPRPPSVDDYFDQLDQAFATLNAAPAQNVPPTQPPQSVPDPSTRETDPAPAPGSATPVGTPGQPSRDPVAVAEAFAALLDIEQGDPGRPAADAWPSLLAAAVAEQVAARVAEEVAERVVGTLVPEIVSRVAERLVREEIERLKSSVDMR